MKKLWVKTTPVFDGQAKKLLTLESIEALFDYVENHPESGDLISGTGGIRKLRWKTGKDNKGKSGGVRVLYHHSKNTLILMIAVYAKSEKENITQFEKNELRNVHKIRFTSSAQIGFRFGHFYC
jgi:hypothetical protein